MQGHDFQLLVNTLPDMKLFEGMLDSPSVRQRMQQLLSLCDDAMVKHCGELKRRIENEEKSLMESLFLFCIGNTLDHRASCGYSLLDGYYK